jgi:hypothetical protein
MGKILEKYAHLKQKLIVITNKRHSALMGAGGFIGLAGGLCGP